MGSRKTYIPQSRSMKQEIILFGSVLILAPIALLLGLAYRNIFIVSAALIFIILDSYSYFFEKWRYSAYEFADSGLVITENIFKKTRIIPYDSITRATIDEVPELGETAESISLEIMKGNSEYVIFRHSKEADFEGFKNDLARKIGADKISFKKTPKTRQ